MGDENFSLDNHRNYNNYEKISDTILFLNNDWRVTFNVKLAYKDKRGERQFYYQEYGYKQTKYNGINNVISIKRNFESYIIIENMADKNNNILIRKPDMVGLKNCLKICLKWLTDTNSNIFAINNDKNMYVANATSCMCQIGENGALRFEPLVIPGNDKDEAGIRLYINDERNYTEITTKGFFDFYESLINFNFHIAACAMIASIPFVPDDVAVNRKDMETGMIGIAKEENARRNGKSFFDKDK